MAVITGTAAAETLPGTAGKDTIDGAGGNDRVLMGGGNDVFLWGPGDGSDIVEGSTGTDTLDFDASAGSETIAIAANGGRVLLSRNVGNVVMDLNDVERIELQALAGVDTISIGDVAGTDLKLVAVDLAGTTPGTGDVSGDNIAVTGSKAANTVNVTQAGGVISVAGYAAKVTIANAEATDALFLQSLAGNDKISAATLAANAIKLYIDGGTGNDSLTGSVSVDTLIGGEGNDTVTSGGGNDTITGGAGKDRIVGGEGDDTINVSAGHAAVVYLTLLDGHDLVTGFDGNATGGQDTFDLDFLFDNLGTLTADRAGRVSVTDKGGTVDIAVNADGDAGNGFELVVATLKTADAITIGQDIVVGALEPD